MIEQEVAQKQEPVVPYDLRRYEQEVYRYVEAELYAHPWRKQEIDRLRSDILGATPERATVRGEGTGDPTLLKAMRLLTSKRLECLTGNYDAITRVHQSLDDVRRRLIEMRYWQREYTDYGVYQRLHISRRTYFRWRRQILKAIAVEIGLL